MAGGCGVRQPPSASVASRVLMPGRVVLGTVRAGSYDDVSRALSHISSNADNHEGVFRPEHYACIFELSMSPEQLCGRFAAMAIGNLAINKANQDKIREEG